MRYITDFMGSIEFNQRPHILVRPEILPSSDPTKDIVGTRIAVEHDGVLISKKVITARFYPLGTESGVSIPLPFYDQRVGFARRRAESLARKISK